MEAKSLTEADIWQHLFGFSVMAVVKCAIDLQIADILERHGGAMSAADLSSAVGCSHSFLRRIMRLLNHRGFFKQEEESYSQTPLSRQLLKNEETSIAPIYVANINPIMLAPWQNLSSSAVTGGPAPFKAAHGEDTWEYAAKNPELSKVINEALACHARMTVREILDGYPEAFEGIGCLVDVGGGDGTAIQTIVKACPWIRGINFDLPHVVSAAPRGGDGDGVEYVGGDMFQQVPKGDAVFLMCVLHDWSDEECVEILKKCKEAIPKEGGKVIIVEAVMGKGEEEKYGDVHLVMDMMMLACTNAGKERTIDEWEYLLNRAAFSSYKIQHIGARSLIQAYPSKY